MTLFVEADAFSDALKRVAPAIGSRPGTLPVLAGVRLVTEDGALRLTASSLDVTITTTVAVSGDIDCVVHHKRLADFVSRCRGKVGLAAQEGELIVEAAPLDLRLRLYDAHDWPNLPGPEGDPLELSAEKTAALRGILYAAGSDTARPILTGLKITATGAACTDSWQLAAIKEEFPLEILVPAGPLSTVLDGPVTIQGNGRHVSFTADSTTTTLRSLEGDYPNYHQLIRSESPVKMVVDRVALLDAVKAVSPIAADTSRDAPIRIVPDGEHVYVCGRSQDVGEARGKVSVSGDCTFEFGLNPRFLREVLEVLDTDDVEFGLVDALKPVQIHDGNVTHLLMPVRLG